jgi:hypothetical protein
MHSYWECIFGSELAWSTVSFGRLLAVAAFGLAPKARLLTGQCR